MNLDYTLIREMYSAGMTLQDIKMQLMQQYPDTVVTIAMLREICGKQIKEHEGRGGSSKISPENTETISVHGCQVKIRKNKNSSIPVEIQDKIQENLVLAQAACASCSFRPAPGHACAWPAGMCQLGHKRPLQGNPRELLDQVAKWQSMYKKDEDEKPKAKVKSQRKNVSVFDDFETAAPTPEEAEKLKELESDIHKAGTAMNPHERIGVALRAAKETADRQYTEMDNFDKDDSYEHDIDAALEEIDAKFNAPDFDDSDDIDADVDYSNLPLTISDMDID